MQYLFSTIRPELYVFLLTLLIIGVVFAIRFLILKFPLLQPLQATGANQLELPFSDETHLARWLNNNGVNTLNWGRNNAKSVSNLFNELRRGESKLNLNKAQREVEYVTVLIHKGDDVLVEVEQKMADGRTRKRNLPPSEKIRAGEGYLETAVRCLEEELKIPASCVRILQETHDMVERASEAFSYPTLPTVYRKHIVWADVKFNLLDGGLVANTPSSASDPIKSHRWAWQPFNTVSGMG